MANPFQHGPSGTNPDAPYANFLPRMGSSYATVVSGSNPALTPSSLSTTRVSYLLNPTNEPTSDLYSTSSRSAMLDGHRSEHSSDRDGSGRPMPLPQLPSFSRAFEMFMPRGSVDSPWTSAQQNTGFFVPSYLKGSEYMTKLEEDHRAKQAQEDTQPHVERAISAAPSENSIGGKPASHLGMTYDLIERVPSSEQASSVPPLPTRWNNDDKWGALEVSANGLEVKYNSALRTTREQEHEICGIRADHPMPTQAGIYYFEVTLLSKRREESTTVCVGFVTKNVSLARPPGWEQDSWGYHGDDGDIYSGGNVGKKYKETTFTTQDVIGCGVNFRTGQAFFTKNGVNLGPAFRDIKGKLYPVVGIKKAGELIRVNFGQSPFVFKIDQVIEKEQNTIKQAISRTSIQRLGSSNMNETELIQQLVLQFLQHDGYVETAREFAKEIRDEQEALNSDRDNSTFPINIKDDEDARQRQRIRRAILEGDIDKALVLTNKFYAPVLKNNHHVYFNLKCRKFVEMVRKAAEYSNGSTKPSNGHFYDDTLSEMDVDDNDLSDTMEDDSMDSPNEPGILLKETITYGQALQAEFKNDPRREVDQTLNEIFALLAYPDPLQVKEIAHLLDRKGRVTVAEELNSAILSSIGKSSRSALENVYGQTSVLLDYLRQDGGPGALISVQSVIDEIPKSQPL
ncbi:ran-binding protein [Nemania sp. FL0916]|nr:ran-binding protein [Nemania sp. FL0916]